MNESFDLCSESDFNIQSVTFLVGSLAILEAANIFFDDSEDSLQISSLLDGKELNIRLKRADIKSVKENYDAGQLEIQLKHSAVLKMNDYLRDFGHSIEVDDPSKHFVEINLKDPYAHEIKRLKKFFPSKTLDVEFEGKGQVIADIEMEDVSYVETKPRGRKKKCESADQEPVKKKPRNNNSLEVSHGLNTRLRSRAGNTNYTCEPIEIIDKNKDSFEVELEIAIKESLKTAFVNDDTINLVEMNDESPKKNKKKKKKNLEPAVDPYAHIDKTIELLRYPSIHVFEPFAGEVVVKMEDFLCLGKAEYLSDVIIDFYLNYIYREKFNDELREKVYIFPSQLYSLYSTNAAFAGWTSVENAGKSAPQKRYERIQGMLDASINIFEKEFLVFPLFNKEHWFLAIVCYPKLQHSVTFEGNCLVDSNTRRNVRQKDQPDYNPIPLKTSCILTFDSIKSNASRRSSAMIHIRHFLKSHWEKNYKGQFELGELISCSVPSPSQSNNVDCGCFLLEFVERFFLTDPMKDFRLPIFKKNWFDSDHVRISKRREIVKVIREKMSKDENIDNSTQDLLPELHFYSEHLAIDLESATNGNENHLENYGNNEEFNSNNNNNDLNCLDNNGAELSTIQNPPCSPILFDTENLEDEPFKVSSKKSYPCIHKILCESPDISSDNEELKLEETQVNANLSTLPTEKLNLDYYDSDSLNENIKEESDPLDQDQVVKQCDDNDEKKNEQVILDSEDVLVNPIVDSDKNGAVKSMTENIISADTESKCDSSTSIFSDD